MTSSIDTKNIDNNFPLPGINQSSQTFRSNTRAITDNLNIAREEISDLHEKTLEVESDLNHIVGESEPFGPQRTAAKLRLNLVETGVTAGSYSGSLTLTVDDFGRIITISEVPPTDIGTAGDYNPQINNFNGTLGSGTSAITVPHLTVDAYGRITEIEMKQLDGFGLLGHNLAANAILAGNSSGRSAAFTAPTATIAQGHYLAYDSTGVLAWKAFPALNEGTVTEVAAGYGIEITDPLVVPIVSLDTAQLVEMPGQNITDADFVVLHSMDGSGYAGGLDDSAVKVLWPDFVNKLDEAFLKEIIEDTAPVLGGDLDVDNHIITGPIDIVIQSGTGRIKLDDQAWPKEIGLEGQVLTVMNGGELAWVTPEEVPEFPVHVSNLESGTGIVVTPEIMAVTGPVSVNVALQKLPARPGVVVAQDEYVVLTGPGVNGTDQYRVPVSEIIPPAAAPTPAPQIKMSLFVLPAGGSDTTGDGSIGKPYQTIQKAINELTTPPVRISYQVVLLAGDYTEPTINVTSINTTFISLLGRNSVRVRSNWTLGTNAVNFQDITFDVSANSTVLPAINVANGTSGIRLIGCDLIGLIEEDAINTVINLEGIQQGAIEVSDCLISGRLVNNLDASQFTEEVALYIDGLRYGQNDGLLLETSGRSRTYMDGVPSMIGILHNGGDLTVDHVAEIFGTTVAPFGNGTDVQYGVVSTANVETVIIPGDPEENIPDETVILGKLVLRDVSLRLTTSLTGDVIAINKTGLAPWYFEDVIRHGANDVIAGQPQNYDETIDAADKVISIAANAGTTTLDPRKSRAYDVTISGNPTLSIAPFVASDAQYAYTFKVIVRQNATGNSNATFSHPGLIWEKSGIQPVPSLPANTITVYEFVHLTSSNQLIGRVSGGGTPTINNVLVEGVVIAAGGTHTIANVGTSFGEPSVDSKHVTVDVTVLDTAVGSPTNGWYVQASGIATIAKGNGANSKAIRIINESTSSQTFNILMSR